jgi:hypothetical protein
VVLAGVMLAGTAYVWVIWLMWFICGWFIWFMWFMCGWLMWFIYVCCTSWNVYLANRRRLEYESEGIGVESGISEL